MNQTNLEIKYAFCGRITIDKVFADFNYTTMLPNRRSCGGELEATESTEYTVRTFSFSFSFSLDAISNKFVAHFAETAASTAAGASSASWWRAGLAF